LKPLRAYTGRGIFRFAIRKHAMTTTKPTCPPGVGAQSEWEAEFESAAHRPLSTRMRYAFIHTYKPVLDDASYRSFDTMQAYRQWCEERLPEWLGYGRV
jgi:hypothetical protein